MQLERGPDGVEEQLKKVEKDLAGLTDAERAPLATEVATLRQQMGSSVNADESHRIELGIKQDLDFAERSRAHNDKWLPWTVEQLTALGITVTPSVGNFILAHFPEAPAKNADAAKADASDGGAPAATLVTPCPTASTTPAPSWPRTHGA